MGSLGWVDWPSVLSTGVGVVAGGLINWYFSRRGSEELRKEANNLRKLNGLTIRILDEANLLPGNVVPTKDAAGNYTGGLTYSATAAAQGRASTQATARVIRAEDSGDQEPH